MITQSTRILRYLRDHAEGITPFEALAEFGCMRLAARIHDLRKQGNDIDEIRCRKVGRYGNIVAFSRYWLADTEDTQRLQKVSLSDSNLKGKA